MIGGILICCDRAAWAQSENKVDANQEQAVASDNRKQLEQAVPVLIQAQKSRSVLSLSGRTLQERLPGTNPLKALHQLAGVTFQSADPWGNNEQNFSIFIHGFSAQQLGYTLDGVPLGDQQYGNYNGLSPQRAVISENVRSVLMSAGAGDLATASTSNLGGTIEHYSSDPLATEKWTIAQTFGSYGASRSYVRYDSGEINANDRAHSQQTSSEPHSFYLSAVRQRARAWDFNAVQGGEQLNAKWIQHVAHTKLSAYYNYSDKTEPNEDSTVRSEREAFIPYTRPTIYPDFEFALNYVNPQGQPPARDGNNYRNYFGVAQRRDHLGYLKSEQQFGTDTTWTNQVYLHLDRGLGAVAGPIGVAGLPALFQVYFPNQDLKKTFGDSGYAVRTTEYQIHRTGLLSHWQQKSGDHQWQLGFWAEHNRSSAYRRWYGLDINRPLSPYQVPREPLITQYGSEIDNQVLQFSVQDEWRLHPSLSVQAGFKSSLQFAGGTFPVQPKLGAIGGGSSALPEGNIITRKWFLPQLGLVWKMSSADQVYANLQKNLRQFVTYGAVGPSPWSLSNQSAFDLFKRTAQPETADTFESGWRSRRQFDAQSTSILGLSAMETQVAVYAVNFHDRLLQISPTPVISSIVNGNPILANVGAVKTRGFDLSVGMKFGPRFSVFNALSLNRSVYQDDYVSGTSRVATSGKQVPGSPAWSNKTSVKWQIKDIEWLLTADYVGKRYATYTNDASVPASLLFGLGMRYRFVPASDARTVDLSLHLSNLTNRTGTSSLLVGAASSSYNTFPIPPRQAFLSLSSSF